MADQDAQDRSQPATPRKLSKAREEGQVARSRDLGHFAAIAAGGAALVSAAPLMADAAKEILMRGLKFNHAMVQDTGFMTDLLAELTARMLWVILPFGALMAAGAILKGGWSWGWPLGLLVTAGAIVGYVASRTVGLPGIPAEPDAWFEPMGVASLVAEGLFVLLFFAAIRARRASA